MPTAHKLAFAAIGLLFCAGASASSLRFYGNGYGDIDRVKIRIDPHVPADIGAGDFTIDFWLKTASGNNAELWRCDVAEQQWNYGNIVFDKSRYGQANSMGVALLSGRIAWGVRTTQGEWTTCTPATPRVDDGTWHHIALQRRASDGRLQIFIDGLLRRDVDGPNGALDYPNGAQPVSWCGSNQSQPCSADPYIVLGAEKHDVDSNIPLAFKGWLDELRLSTSLRWAGSFAPQVTPYAVDAATAALYHFDEGAGDVINDAVGASGGVRKNGGSPAGPEWSTDSPISGGSEPPPPPPPPPTAEVWKVRLSTTGFRVRTVYRRNGDGSRGSQLQIPGAYGVATSVYVDAGIQETLPTCNPSDVATLNGVTYMAVTGPAVSQHGLPILGQQMAGYVSPCDRVQ
jgi:hypothetical protein